MAECERCSWLAMQVNALEEVIRGVVIASRPGTAAAERDRAWRAAGAVMNINERRKDKDFVARLAEVRERHGSDGPPKGREEDAASWRGGLAPSGLLSVPDPINDFTDEQRAALEDHIRGAQSDGSREAT
jgi:hypothetical protein